MQTAVSEYLAEIGRKGGKSRSAAKVAAVRINAAKATAGRKNMQSSTTKKS